jgi:hypothetical protein
MQWLTRARIAATGTPLTHVPMRAGCSTRAASHTASPLPTSRMMAAPAVEIAACQTLATAGQPLTWLSKDGEHISSREAKTTQQRSTLQLHAIAARTTCTHGLVSTQIQAANNAITAAMLRLPGSVTIARTAMGLQGFHSTSVTHARAAPPAARPAAQVYPVARRV